MRRIVVFTVLSVVALAGFSSAAQAASPTWDCRASALRTTILGGTTEPLVANAPASPCVAEEPATAPVSQTPLAGVGLTANSTRAKTTLTPSTGAAIGQVATAEGGVTGDVGVSIAGVASLTIKGAVASASAACVGSSPALNGSSTVTSISVQPLIGSAIPVPITPGDHPLPLGLGTVNVGEQTVAGGQLTQRAVHLNLNLLVGAIDLVIGEARVGANGAVCAKSAYPPGTPTDGGLPGGGQNSAGVRVISLDEARRLYGDLPCLRGKLPTTVIVGTAGNDRITGTKGRDRILGLGGNDTINAGNGVDCADGGIGNDRVSGGAGNDGLYGDKGNDYLVGGSGNDVIRGGSGNDRILGGAGSKDKAYGGPGNDNISDKGKRDKVSCGPGDDKVVMSHASSFRPSSCERVKA